MPIATRTRHITGVPNYINIGSYALDKTTFDAIADPANLDYGDILNAVGLKRLGELVNEDNTADRPDYNVVRDTVLRAEAEVNGYLARRYDIPAVVKTSTDTVTVPNQVYDWTLAVLKHKFYSRRPVIPEDVVQGYQHATRQLELAGRGTIQIVDLTLDADGIPESTKPDVVSVVGNVNRGTNILGRNYNESDTSGFSV